MGNPRYCIFKKVQYLYIHIPSVCCVVHFVLTFGALLLAGTSLNGTEQTWERLHVMERGEKQSSYSSTAVYCICLMLRDDDTSFPTILNFWLGYCNCVLHLCL